MYHYFSYSGTNIKNHNPNKLRASGSLKIDNTIKLELECLTLPSDNDWCRIRLSVSDIFFLFLFSILKIVVSLKNDSQTNLKFRPIRARLFSLPLSVMNKKAKKRENNICSKNPEKKTYRSLAKHTATHLIFFSLFFSFCVFEFTLHKWINVWR